MRRYLPTVFGENLMDWFDNAFDSDFFREVPNGILYGKNAGRMMKTDVKETESGYELDVELPGFQRENLNVELENGYMTISAEKALEKNRENEEGRLLRRERYSGTLRRSFYVGEQLTDGEIKASYEDGILHLTLPKKNPPQLPEKRTILIE